MKVKLIAIAALGKNRQIGLKGALPWKIPEEYQHFLTTVKDQYVLIGRRNFELHGHGVPGARCIVLTRDKNYRHENSEVFTSMDEVILFLEKNKIFKLYVIGGAEIYQLALPYVTEFLWTETNYDGPADVYFPEFKTDDWQVEEIATHPEWKLRRLYR